MLLCFEFDSADFGVLSIRFIGWIMYIGDLYGLSLLSFIGWIMYIRDLYGLSVNLVFTYC